MVSFFLWSCACKYVYETISFGECALPPSPTDGESAHLCINELVPIIPLTWSIVGNESGRRVRSHYERVLPVASFLALKDMLQLEAEREAEDRRLLLNQSREQRAMRAEDFNACTTESQADYM